MKHRLLDMPDYQAPIVQKFEPAPKLEWRRLCRPIGPTGNRLAGCKCFKEHHEHIVWAFAVLSKKSKAAEQSQDAPTLRACDTAKAGGDHLQSTIGHVFSSTETGRECKEQYWRRRKRCPGSPSPQRCAPGRTLPSSSPRLPSSRHREPCL